MNMISFISLLLLAMLCMATSIVLFHHLQKTKKQLERRNNGLEEAIKAEMPDALEEAIRLFTEQPELDIEDVLERSGFNAKMTFYIVFKDATGMSPAAFRQALHGNVYDPEKPI